MDESINGSCYFSFSFFFSLCSEVKYWGSIWERNGSIRNSASIVVVVVGGLGIAWCCCGARGVERAKRTRTTCKLGDHCGCWVLCDGIKWTMSMPVSCLSFVFISSSPCSDAWNAVAMFHLLPPNHVASVWKWM